MKHILAKIATKQVVKRIAVDLTKLLEESNKLEKSYIKAYGGMKKGNNMKTTIKIPTQSINDLLEESSANKRFDFY